MILPQFPDQLCGAFNIQLQLERSNDSFDITVGKKQLLADLLSGIALTEKLRDFSLIIRQLGSDFVGDFF